jgi:hypothetical protein
MNLSTIYFLVSKVPKSLMEHLSQDDSDLSIEEKLPDFMPSNPNKDYYREDWVWPIQTFLYMREAGLDVRLAEQPVEGAICVAKFDITKNKIFAPNSFLVGIRADRSPFHMCEIEVVQNPVHVKGKHTFPVHHWPQPRLRQRDASRGDRIERISYFGGPQNLAPSFSEPAFINALADMGVELHKCFDPRKWNDYSATDLVLAVRNIHPVVLNTKPATKLVNAWKAGCVPLLGPESAYQAIGRRGVDYFEVTHPCDVIAVLTQLKANPELYQQVRQAGIQRYPEFSHAAIQQQWIELFTGPVAEAYAQWQQGIGKHRFVCHVRRSWQAARQWADHKLFHTQVKLWEKLYPSYDR